MGNLKLTTTDKQFSAKVFSLLAKKIDPQMLKAVGPIENRIRNLMRNRLASDPIIDELKNGQLALDFGLSPTMANNAISEMLEAIDNSISVRVLKGGKLFSVGFSGLNISIDPIGPIAGIPAGSYDSNGHLIEWMDWLLYRGSQVVVSGFESVYALNTISEGNSISYAGESRSGLGFMIKTGNSFRVDPRFSGTKESNFLTKIVKGSRVVIETIIKEEINKVL